MSSRGTVLETHRRDVGLGLCAVAQHRRLGSRAFRVLRRGGGSGTVAEASSVTSNDATRAHRQSAGSRRVLGRPIRIRTSDRLRDILGRAPRQHGPARRADGSRSSTAPAPASPGTATRAPPCGAWSRPPACPGARSSTTSGTRKRCSSRSPSRTPGAWPTSWPSRASCRSCGSCSPPPIGEHSWLGTRLEVVRRRLRTDPAFRERWRAHSGGAHAWPPASGWSGSRAPGRCATTCRSRCWRSYLELVLEGLHLAPGDGPGPRRTTLDAVLDLVEGVGAGQPDRCRTRR